TEAGGRAGPAPVLPRARACTVAQLPGTVRQTTGSHLRRCCIARIGAQEVTDVSHTDDDARAGAGPAGGPGLSRRAFVGAMAGAAGLGLAACSSGLKGGSYTSTGSVKMGLISRMTGAAAGFAILTSL